MLKLGILTSVTYDYLFVFFLNLRMLGLNDYMSQDV